MTRYFLEPLRNALRQRIDEEGLRPFSERTGIPPGQVRSFLDGRASRGPTIDAIARALGLQLYLGSPASDVSNVEMVGLENAGHVPLLSWVQAGEWAAMPGAFDLSQCEEWVLCPVRHSDKTFVLRVRGASMQPDYTDGDWIFVDPERQPVNGSHVVVSLDDNNEATFKKLVMEGEMKYLEALNPDWPDRIIRVNGNASFVGVVIFSGKPR